MALDYCDGFAGQDLANRYALSSTNTWSYVTGRAGYGTALDGSVANGGLMLTRGHTATAKVIVGLAARRTTGASSDNEFLRLQADGGGTTHITVKFVNGGIQITRAGTLLASASGIDTTIWHYYEVSATQNTSTGTVVVRVDGAIVINFTGNTKNGGVSSNFDTVTFGVPGAASTTHYQFTDLYICTSVDSGIAGMPNNDFLGDVRVSRLQPTAAGANTGLTPSAAPNWSDVDEAPPSSTDYVSGSVVGAKDTYTMSDLPTGAANVFGVQVVAIAKKTDTGTRNLKTTVRVGSTDYSGAAAALTTDDQPIIQMRQANPATSARWTVADVNAAEAGVEVA